MDENARRIAELIGEGRKLEAVKLLRETTGMDLKRALEEVERLMAGEPPAPSTDVLPDASGISAEVRSLALAGKKIEAIKLLREQTGLGLKEAKEQVEAVPGVSRGSGCAGVVILLAVLGGLLTACLA